MPKLWDPESPEMCPAIVCHADILGFTNMTRDSLKSGAPKEFLSQLKAALSTTYDRLRKQAKLGGPFLADSSHTGKEDFPVFDMKVFTDNIIVAYPYPPTDIAIGEPELGSMLMLFAEAQANLAEHGFFLRGAIATGLHYQDDDLVFGEALLEAVELDKSGSAPRLVIAPSVENLILKHLEWYGDGESPYHYRLLEDPSDGRLFINYLQSAFGHFPDGPINYELLQAQSKTVTSRLQQYEDNENVRKKYEWIATYHNYACRSFVERNVIQPSEWVDPEEGAKSDYAAQAGNHLIPFDGDTPPLRLNEERLRIRLNRT